MKKKIILILTLTFMAFGISACGNRKFFDTTYTFNRALIEMPGGEVKELNIVNWRDYEDGDQLQIKATDGNTYLIHSSKCVLMAN